MLIDTESTAWLHKLNGKGLPQNAEQVRLLGLPYRFGADLQASKRRLASMP